MDQNATANPQAGSEPSDIILTQGGAASAPDADCPTCGNGASSVQLSFVYALAKSRHAFRG